MELFQRHWPAGEPKATIVLVHGTAEHSGRYEHVARFLNEHGYSVRAGDLPGWGRSPGKRGHVERFEEYTDAVGHWVTQVWQRTPDRPIYVMGHSLGGLVAIRFVQTYQHPDRLAGLILSSPCVKLKLEVPLWKASLAEFLDRLWPTLRMGNEIAPHQVTRDEEMRERYISDPLNYKKVSVRWFQQLRRAMELAWQDADRLTLPVLAMQAGADCLIDPQGVEAFVGRTPARDKTFVPFSGLYHEILNEPERDAVLQTLVTWLEDQQVHRSVNVTY